jgi:hypothetical protein
MKIISQGRNFEGAHIHTQFINLDNKLSQVNLNEGIPHFSLGTVMTWLK